MNFRAPFFSKKNLVTFAACALIAYVISWGAVLTVRKLDHDNKTQTLRAQQAQRDSISKEEKAISKAESYLRVEIRQVDPASRLILDYMQRKFKLDKELGKDGTVPITLTSDPRTYPNEIDYVARIAFPDKLVRVVPKTSPSGVSLTNVYGANCDILPLPADFWSVMEQNVSKGGYFVTHNALALAFIKDNGCSIPPSEGDLQTKVNDALVTLADDPKTIPDIRYEAIAFLQLNGRYDLVQPKWIDQIVSEQQNDGGWSEQQSGTKPSAHATLLALWALLEYNHPNKPYEPLIHRPTPQL